MRLSRSSFGPRPSWGFEHLRNRSTKAVRDREHLGERLRVLEHDIGEPSAAAWPAGVSLITTARRSLGTVP
jgi:hypothetical protein